MNRAEGIAAPLHPARVGPLIRARRHSLRMTLQALGQASGVSVGYLSQVERDQSLPSLGTLAAIAMALGVGVDYFIAAPSAQDALSRAGERMRFSVNDSLISYERLHTEFAGNILSSFLIVMQPGYRSETVTHEGEEIIYVLEGSLSVNIEGEEMMVNTGDSLHFRGNRRHNWSNLTDQPIRLLWSGTLKMFHGRSASASALGTSEN